MHYVYLLRSTVRPQRTHIGHTDDVERQLIEHNQGDSACTAKHRPWTVVALIGIPSLEKALALERYLQSGSGHAFARRHLWS